MYLIKSLIVLFLFFNSTLYAKDEIYFFPKDSKIVEEKLINYIKESKDSIDIAMYNLSYKKLLKELKKASKRGIFINLYLDKAKLKKSSKINKFLEETGIKYKILDKKNHLKLAMFDKKIAILGSLNWTKESFEENYEVIYITKNKDELKQIKNIFNELESK